MTKVSKRPGTIPSKYNQLLVTQLQIFSENMNAINALVLSDIAKKFFNDFKVTLKRVMVQKFCKIL